MKKRFLIVLLILSSLLSMSIVFSHEGKEDEFRLNHSALDSITQLQALGYGSLIFGILIVLVAIGVIVYSKGKPKEPSVFDGYLVR